MRIDPDRLRHMNTCSWILELFGKIMESLEDRALIEKVHHLRFILNVYILTVLPIYGLYFHKWSHSVVSDHLLTPLDSFCLPIGKSNLILILNLDPNSKLELEYPNPNLEQP